MTTPTIEDALSDPRIPGRLDVAEEGDMRIVSGLHRRITVACKMRASRPSSPNHLDCEGPEPVDTRQSLKPSFTTFKLAIPNSLGSLRRHRARVKAEDRTVTLVGTAALNYDFFIEVDASGPRLVPALDVAFSNNQNIGRDEAHGAEPILFPNLAVSSDGTFQAGVTGERIQGGFSGPSHAESARPAWTGSPGPSQGQPRRGLRSLPYRPLRRSVRSHS